MTEYRRAQVPGATWFFTVNLAERSGNRLLVVRIDALLAAFDVVRVRHPFRMAAVVIPVAYPHLHMKLSPQSLLARRGCFRRGMTAPREIEQPPDILGG